MTAGTPFEIEEAAYRIFGRWLIVHDPDGELGSLEAAIAYSDWASKNDLTPYLDGAQP